MEVPEKFLNKNKYKQAKRWADETYSRNGAYKSMGLIKKYKALGGKIDESKSSGKLERWRDEKWISVLDYLDGKIVPCGDPKIGNNACRPLIRINEQTPITIKEVIKKHGKRKVKQLALEKINNMNKRVNWVAGTIK